MKTFDKLCIVFIVTAPLWCALLAAPGFFWIIFWFVFAMEANLAVFGWLLNRECPPHKPWHPRGPSYSTKTCDGLTVRNFDIR